MIVKMSKVEIVGPKTLLEDVLSFLQNFGVFQLEPNVIGFVDKVDENYFSSLMPDEKTFKERIYLESLKKMIDELSSYLPYVPTREGYLNPSVIIDTISENLKKHLNVCRELANKKKVLETEFQELSHLKLFFDAIQSLALAEITKESLDFIGFVVKEKSMVDELKRSLMTLLKGKMSFHLTTLPDGTVLAVVVVEKEEVDKIKKLSSEKHIPDYNMPEALRHLSFKEKREYVNTTLSDISKELTSINNDLQKYAVRWLPIYNQVRSWIDEKLSIITAMVSAFETKMCFFIYGWMPSKDYSKIKKEIDKVFQGKVVIEEREIREEDLERIPVILKNPPYFKAFEIFVKFLPLPKYGSYDPTPFIGIFFPLFFGMILGDAGYGLILMLISVLLSKKYKTNQNILNVSKVMFVCSLYTCFFGVLYGEFFGELPQMFLGIEPLWIERRKTILPVLYFTVTVGVVHIILGMALGAISAYKRRTKKELVFKILNILLIICIIILIAAAFGIFPSLITKPLIIAILIFSPLLLFTGGLLAPLEVLKSIGNIISYTRIMAIGVSSVLIAFVANKMAGMVGNIVIGIIVAFLLHVINILLGMFSPTIHSLRLHYVEFFSKFLEQGGKKYTPFKKTVF